MKVRKTKAHTFQKNTITHDQIKLWNALKLAKIVVDPKMSTPVLRGVCLSPDRLEATNLSNWLSIPLSGKGEGSMVLPLSSLMVLVKPNTRKTAEIRFTPDENQEKIKISSLDLNGALNNFPPEEWPGRKELYSSSNPEWPSCGVDAGELRDSLGYVLPSAEQQNSTTLHLERLHFSGNQIVATDGYRVHWAPLVIQGMPGFLLPSAGALILHKLLSSTSYPVLDVNLVLSPDEQHPHLLVDAGYWSLWSEVLTDTSRFPPVDQVLPPVENISATAVVSPKELIRLIKRLKRLGREFVEIKLGDSALVISGENKEGDSRVDLTLPARISGQTAGHDEFHGRPAIPPGRPVLINPGYLVEALTSLGAEATLGFRSPYDPVRIDDGKKTAAVMPIRT